MTQIISSGPPEAQIAQLNAELKEFLNQREVQKKRILQLSIDQFVKQDKLEKRMHCSRVTSICCGPLFYPFILAANRICCQKKQDERQVTRRRDLVKLALKPSTGYCCSTIPEDHALTIERREMNSTDEHIADLQADLKDVELSIAKISIERRRLEKLLSK